MSKTERTIELEFTTLEFYESFVVSRLKEGTIFSQKQVQDLIDICSDFYEGKKFVYLSLRINNYNVNPTIYLGLEKVRNLAGIGIISNNKSTLNMAQFEKNFSKVPFEIFIDYEDATEWAGEILQK